MKKILILLLTLLILQNCTQVQFDNPLDSKGENYIGDAALADDDNDGILNYLDKDSKYFSLIRSTITLDDKDIPWEEIRGDSIELTIKYNIQAFNDIKSIYYKFFKKGDGDEGELKEWDDSITNGKKIGGISKTFYDKGYYKLVFKVIDNKDNSITQTLFFVLYKKEDVNGSKPEITLKSQNSVEITLKERWVEPGYEAIDQDDGDITSWVIIECYNQDGQKIDLKSFPQEEGIYKMAYKVIDLDGHTAQAERKVYVTSRDSADQPPHITLKGDSILYLTLGEVFDDPGAIAYDAEDGDITDKIQVEGEVNSNEQGEYLLTYYVEDSKGHKESINRKVIVKDNDNIPPVIVLKGQKEYVISIGTNWMEFEPGFKVIDNVDQNLENKVTIKVIDENGKEVNIEDFTQKVGQYTIEYSVKDNSGNEADTQIRKVQVIEIEEENTPPIIQLLGDSIIEIQKNDSYEDPGAVAYDAEDGDLTDKIEIDGEVNTSKEGEYIIIYKVKDSGGLIARARRKVIVTSE